MGLGSIPFRSPLLGESLLLSFPRGTEMFQFPRFPLPALYIQAGVTLHLVLGFPIRKSTDHSLVDDYPWLIAVSYVLHRLQAPRHPPLALSNLKDIYINKMLVLAMQFSRNKEHLFPKLGEDARGSNSLKTEQRRITFGLRRKRLAPTISLWVLVLNSQAST